MPRRQGEQLCKDNIEAVQYFAGAFASSFRNELNSPTGDVITNAVTFFAGQSASSFNVSTTTTNAVLTGGVSLALAGMSAYISYQDTKRRQEAFERVSQQLYNPGQLRELELIADEVGMVLASWFQISITHDLRESKNIRAAAQAAAVRAMSFILKKKLDINRDNLLRGVLHGSVGFLGDSVLTKNRLKGYFQSLGFDVYTAEGLFGRFSSLIPDPKKAGEDGVISASRDILLTQKNSKMKKSGQEKRPKYIAQVPQTMMEQHGGEKIENSRVISSPETDTKKAILSMSDMPSSEEDIHSNYHNLLNLPFVSFTRSDMNMYRSYADGQIHRGQAICSFIEFIAKSLSPEHSGDHKIFLLRFDPKWLEPERNTLTDSYDLTDFNFSGLDFSSCIFNYAELPAGTKMENVNFRGSYLRHVSFKISGDDDDFLDNVDFSCAHMEWLHAEKIKFRPSTKMSGAICDFANFSGSSIPTTLLTCAKFRFATLDDIECQENLVALRDDQERKIKWLNERTSALEKRSVELDNDLKNMNRLLLKVAEDRGTNQEDVQTLKEKVKVYMSMTDSLSTEIRDYKEIDDEHSRILESQLEEYNKRIHHLELYLEDKADESSLWLGGVNVKVLEQIRLVLEHKTRESLVMPSRGEHLDLLPCQWQVVKPNGSLCHDQIDVTYANYDDAFKRVTDMQEGSILRKRFDELEKELGELEKDKTPRLLCIEGPSGLGKSTTMNDMANYFYRKGDRFKWVFPISCVNAASSEAISLCDFVYNALFRDYATADTPPFRSVFGRFWRSNIVTDASQVLFVFDGLEATNNRHLKSCYDRLISGRELTGCSVMVSYIGSYPAAQYVGIPKRTFRLSPWSEELQREYINWHLWWYEPDDLAPFIEHVFGQAGLTNFRNNPRMLRLLCDLFHTSGRTDFEHLGEYALYHQLEMEQLKTMFHGGEEDFLETDFDLNRLLLGELALARLSGHIQLESAEKSVKYAIDKLPKKIFGKSEERKLTRQQTLQMGFFGIDVSSPTDSLDTLHYYVAVRIANALCGANFSINYDPLIYFRRCLCERRSRNLVEFVAHELHRKLSQGGSQVSCKEAINRLWSIFDDSETRSKHVSQNEQAWGLDLNPETRNSTIILILNTLVELDSQAYKEALAPVITKITDYIVIKYNLRAMCKSNVGPQYSQLKRSIILIPPEENLISQMSPSVREEVKKNINYRQDSLTIKPAKPSKSSSRSLFGSPKKTHEKPIESLLNHLRSFDNHNYDQTKDSPPVRQRVTSPEIERVIPPLVKSKNEEEQSAGLKLLGACGAISLLPETFEETLSIPSSHQAKNKDHNSAMRENSIKAYSLEELFLYSFRENQEENVKYFFIFCLRAFIDKRSFSIWPYHSNAAEADSPLRSSTESTQINSPKNQTICLDSDGAPIEVDSMLTLAQTRFYENAIAFILEGIKNDDLLDLFKKFRKSYLEAFHEGELNQDVKLSRTPPPVADSPQMRN